MSEPFDHAPQFSFTAATTDLLTSSGSVPVPGTAIQFYAGSGLPAPLSANTTYYALAGTLTTNFKVSTTFGGSPVDITSTGTAPNYFAGAGTILPPCLGPLMKATQYAGRLIDDMGVSSYKLPPPPNKLELGYVYESVIGTLSGGGESWG